MSMAVFEDTLISGGDDSLVRVWDTNNWSYGQILRAHKDEVWSIRINSDGTMITG